jgi:hypothetical protein
MATPFIELPHHFSESIQDSKYRPKTLTILFVHKESRYFKSCSLCPALKGLNVKMPIFHRRSEVLVWSSKGLEAVLFRG